MVCDTSPDTLERALLHLIPWRPGREKIRTNQRTCPLYPEWHKWYMLSFPRLSDQFSDDSPMGRIVVGQYSLKGLVMLETLEEDGDEQLKE